MNPLWNLLAFCAEKLSDTLLTNVLPTDSKTLVTIFERLLFDSCNRVTRQIYQFRRYLARFIFVKEQCSLSEHTISLLHELGLATQLIQVSFEDDFWVFRLQPSHWSYLQLTLGRNARSRLNSCLSSLIPLRYQIKPWRRVGLMMLLP